MSSVPRVYVVTGADSGLGQAVARRVAADGHVIVCGQGVDMDVRADLSIESGRRELIEALRGTRIDGVLAVAGMGAPSPQTAALNFFGTTAVLEGLREQLSNSPAPAVAIVSSSSTLNRGSGSLVRACLRGDEEKALATARRLVRTGRGSQIYRSSKAALNLWVRAASVKPEWAGEGIVLNALAPGVIATESVMRAWSREKRLLQTALPQPLGAPGPVEPVAEVLANLVAPANRFMTGQVIYCDGGTDALMRGARSQSVFLRYRLRDMATMLKEARRRPSA